MNNKLVEQRFKNIKKDWFSKVLDYDNFLESRWISFPYNEFIDFFLFIELLKEYEEYSNIYIEKDDFECFIKFKEKRCYIFNHVLIGDITEEIEEFLYDNNIDTSWNNYVIEDSKNDDMSDSYLFEIIDYDLKNCLSLLKVNSNIKNRFLKIENKYVNKIKNLYKMKYSELIEFYYEDFKESLIKYICKNQIAFQDNDKENLEKKCISFFLINRQLLIILNYYLLINWLIIIL